MDLLYDFSSAIADMATPSSVCGSGENEEAVASEDKDRKDGY
jgi:hypothetical protein